MKSGTFVCVENFVYCTNEKKHFVIGKCRKFEKDLYTTPCKSSGIETFEEANDVLEYLLDCSASDVSEIERRYKSRKSENRRASKLRKIDMQENVDIFISGRDLGELPTSTPKRINSSLVEVVDINESPALQLADEEFKRNTNAKIGKFLYEQKILAEQQQIILLNQEKILGLLLQKESSLPQLESEDMRKMFPLKTVKDLDDLSSLIAEEGNMKQLVRICKSVGGIDVKQSVKFLMHRLLTDQVCAAFSFQGRPKEPAFDHFLINEAIKNVFKSWLLYWRDLRKEPQLQASNEDDTLKEVINCSATI
ncbi:hypothetical protein JTE90_011091 [Oedothorax gibbosus]|uniref:DUF4806 domain-containing protein n=1 Tax=Oedothorax gibbosus TaxID=931172 RepID=A0AAV6TWI7_9ARAC|nr:hypothetical protein JTE90_011091 [Oedothorax gibbosus]